MIEINLSFYFVFANIFSFYLFIVFKIILVLILHLILITVNENITGFLSICWYRMTNSDKIQHANL